MTQPLRDEHEKTNKKKTKERKKKRNKKDHSEIGKSRGILTRRLRKHPTVRRCG